jgi:hypothetical protein
LIGFFTSHEGYMQQTSPGAPVPLEQTRQSVIQQLCGHFAVDNLSAEALEERLDRAHAAASLAELRTLVADLPVVREGAPITGPRTFATPAHVSERQVVVAVMGGAERKGVWAPARNLYVVAVMGGAEIDLREARFAPGVTEIYAVAIMGGVEIVVPPGVHVDMSGLALMGGFGHGGRVEPPTDPAAPVLRIGGLALMGGVEVSVRYPGERPRDARRREKLEREARKRLR